MQAEGQEYGTEFAALLRDRPGWKEQRRIGAGLKEARRLLLLVDIQLHSLKSAC